MPCGSWADPPNGGQDAGVGRLAPVMGKLQITGPNLG
jgi:hypothetical protein